MKRSNTRLVKLPILLKEGMRGAVTLEEAREKNAFSYNYAVRSAIPTLQTLAIEPWMQTIKDTANVEAQRQRKFDEQEVIKETYTYRHTLEGKAEAGLTIASATVEMTRRPHRAYEKMLADFRLFLENIIEDRQRRDIRRDCIRKAGAKGAPHVQLPYLRDELARLTDQYTSPITHREVTLCDEKGEEVESDKSIKECSVYLSGDKRYTLLTRASAREVHRAQSLQARLNSFVADFKKAERDNHAIPAKGLLGPQEFDYDLSEGAAVRFLFYPKGSTDYGKVIARLTDEPKKAISSGTGDFFIIDKHAFQDPYVYAQGQIEVHMEEAGAREGVILIHRGRAATLRTTRYSLLKHDGILHVAAPDILDALTQEEKRVYDTDTNIKIDFFPPIPPHLQ